MPNEPLYINPETRDLEFDGYGVMRMIGGDETTAQNVRLTLLAGKGSFPLDTAHGTEYDRFLGRKDTETSKTLLWVVIVTAIVLKFFLPSARESCIINARKITSGRTTK